MRRVRREPGNCSCSRLQVTGQFIPDAALTTITGESGQYALGPQDLGAWRYCRLGSRYWGNSRPVRPYHRRRTPVRDRRASSVAPSMSTASPTSALSGRPVIAQPGCIAVLNAHHLHRQIAEIEVIEQGSESARPVAQLRPCACSAVECSIRGVRWCRTAMFGEVGKQKLRDVPCPDAFEALPDLLALSCKSIALRKRWTLILSCHISGARIETSSRL